jgi:predicted nucleotidyltransferase
MMQLEEIKKAKQQIYQIAARRGIIKIYVFGSFARGENDEVSDIDFFVELEDGASVFGVGAFQYEAQKLLGIHIDVIPAFTLPNVEDRSFAQSVQAEAVAL